MQRCDECKHPVFYTTLHSWGRKMLCSECLFEVRRPKVNKYGTAEHVEKKDGKAIISDRKLSGRELEKLAAGKKPRKVVVTEENYRVDDETDPKV